MDASVKPTLSKYAAKRDRIARGLQEPFEFKEAKRVDEPSPASLKIVTAVVMRLPAANAPHIFLQSEAKERIWLRRRVVNPNLFGALKVGTTLRCRIKPTSAHTGWLVTEILSIEKPSPSS